MAERPDHPFVLFNLGMTYCDAKKYADANRFLQQCLAVSKPEESHLRKAYSLLVSGLRIRRNGTSDEATARQQGTALFPDDKELLFRTAILHHHFGRLRDAEQTYFRVLNGQEERHFSSIDRALTGFKARHNLAIVYDEMGRLDKAEEQWRRIVQEVPSYRAGWHGLADVLSESRIACRMSMTC